MERGERGWETEAQEQSKLVVMYALLPIGGKVNCGDVLCKRRRRICGPKD